MAQGSITRVPLPGSIRIAPNLDLYSIVGILAANTAPSDVERKRRSHEGVVLPELKPTRQHDALL